MGDWRKRTELLLGKDAMERLGRASVVVVGVGGVGSWAAEMLVRSGVGHIVLIDNDTVSASNMNRQLEALGSTVGRLKTAVLEERFRDINPGLEITCLNEYLDTGNVSSAIGGLKPDFLIDAIDTLAPKLALINYCKTNGIPFVSSMGSGAKFDVCRIRIADISKTFNCPLAHIVRKRLRKEYGISGGFPAVFSEELPTEEAIVAEEGRNKKSQVGSIAYLSAAFGCACAQVAISALAGIRHGESGVSAVGNSGSFR